MIIVKLVGGLGNQMFQYAAARRLARKHGTVLMLDLSEFKRYKLRRYELGGFNISVGTASAKDFFALRVSPAAWYRKLYKLAGIFGLNLNPRYVVEKYLPGFDPNFLNLSDNVYLAEGHWSNYKYFADAEETIRKEFVPGKIGAATQKIANDIGRSNAAFIHIRRGDVVVNGDATETEYYGRAIAFIKERIKEPKFFVFSDDAEWVRKNINFNAPTEFVSSTPGISICEEIYLMGLCSACILSNYSTFGWWGAFLGNKEKTWIISQKKGAGFDHVEAAPEGTKIFRI